MLRRRGLVLSRRENAYADAVALAMDEGAVPVVPVLWHSEVANMAITGERRRRCTAQEVDGWLKKIAPQAFVTDRMLAEDIREHLLRLARTYGLTAYDATYLELAMRRRLPLATLDGALTKAAERAKLGRFAPR